jgi:hypothetical protein
MPGRHPAGLLHVQRDAIPAVRAAFEEALTELRPHLQRLQQDAVIPKPWLGDITSADVVTHYTERVIKADQGPLTAILAYQDELTRILDNLKAMEDGYVRSDGESAERFRA